MMASGSPLCEASPPSFLQDGLGRHITYVRLSVTDRCDLRCLYCMAEHMVFQPRADILSFEEIDQLAQVLVDLGIRKIRLTGGEPLVRKGIVDLVRRLSSIRGLNELVMTTNGTRLSSMAQALRDAGISRINISLDTLRPDRYRALTRVGSLSDVLEGIESANRAGFEAVKINAVILRGRNFDEVNDLVHFVMERDMDISFIEEMPLGAVDGRSRVDEFCSSEEIRGHIEKSHSLLPTPHKTGGPARFFGISGSRTRIGFISPQTHNFCSDCNRIRITADGKLLPCLGDENATDLRTILRQPGASVEDLKADLKREVRSALVQKPERHAFQVTEAPLILRHMNRTGG